MDIMGSNGFHGADAIRAGQVRLAGAASRLASGDRLFSAATDPAALITSENLMATLAALDAESRSVARGESVARTADGVLGGMSDLLLDARTHAVAAANEAGLSDEERAAHQMEVDSIMSTVNRLASTSTFNGDRLFDGDTVLRAGGGEYALGELSASALGVVGLEVGSASALDSIDGALDAVRTTRGELGAFSRYTLDPARDRIAITSENVAAANSVLRDADFAAEVVEMSRASIQVQAGVALVLAEDQMRSRVLDLLA